MSPAITGSETLGSPVSERGSLEQVQSSAVDDSLDGIVAELEGASGVVLGALRRQLDVGTGVGEESAGDFRRRGHTIELAVRDEALNVGAATLPTQRAASVSSA